MGKLGLPAQIVMTLPLLEGLDGVEKMSKSLGNYVAVEDPPEEMFGKLMSVSDALMWRYWMLLTDVPPADIEARRTAVRRGERHPMDVKFELARVITTEFHGADATAAAEQRFRAVHQRREAPDAIEEVRLAESAAPLLLARVLVLAGLAPSNSEARRLILQGGVKVDGTVVRDPLATVAAKAGSTLLVQVGKRRFARVAFA
jgi:tyrosyl-tRNA synthetase